MLHRIFHQNMLHDNLTYQQLRLSRILCYVVTKPNHLFSSYIINTEHILVVEIWMQLKVIF